MEVSLSIVLVNYDVDQLDKYLSRDFTISNYSNLTSIKSYRYLNDPLKVYINYKINILF